MNVIYRATTVIVAQAVLAYGVYQQGHHDGQMLGETRAEFRGYKEAITSLMLATDPNDLAGLCTVVNDYQPDEGPVS